MSRWLMHYTVHGELLVDADTEDDAKLMLLNALDKREFFLGSVTVYGTNLDSLPTLGTSEP